MEKCCRSCKWYHKQRCNCKGLKEILLFTSKMGDFYVEDGIFIEQIRESGLIEKLVENISIDLEDQGFIKKNKNINKFIPNEEELVEFIDDKLSPGIINYFDGECSEILINESREFVCEFWE